jgi:hypothetical protein
MLIIRRDQMDALQGVVFERKVDDLVAEIHGDFPDAAREAGDDEIRASIAQAVEAAPRLGFESWAGAAMLAKVTFLLGEAPWEAPDLGFMAKILEDKGYPTEAAKMEAFIDAVAAHVDGMADADAPTPTAE